MSGQSQRLNVAPTVTMLGVMKVRLVGATRGRALLKKKSDALTVQFLQILKKREIERQLAAAKTFAEEKFAEKISLKEGISVNAAHNLLNDAMPKDEDIIF